MARRKVYALFGSIALDGMKTVNKQLAGFDKNLKNASKQLAKTGRQFEKIGTSFTKTFTVPLALAGGAVLKFGSDFEKAMKTSTAIMGDLSDELKKKMADTAKTVSTTTTRSASDLAKAYYYLASAGFDAAQSISALPRVAKFAEAGQFDLQLATDLLTDAQSALGLTTKDVVENEKNMVRVSDVLVRANTLANASVQQFSEALTTRAGAALRILGKDVEEGAAVLAAYADQGVKAAAAGTQFGIVLRDLQKATLANAGVFKKYNVAVYDSNGEMRNMADILAELERALEAKSDAEKKSILSMMGFQEKSVASLLTLIGTSEKIREYEKALRDAGGTTDKVAKEQLDNFQDQLKMIRNRLVNVAITLSNDLLPILKDRFIPWIEKSVLKIQDMVDWFRRLNPGIKNNIVRILGLIAVIGPLLIVLGKTMKALAGLRAMVLLLNTALLTNPIGIVAVALVGLTAAVIGTCNAYKDLNKTMDEYRKKVSDDVTARQNTLIIGTLEELIYNYKKLANMDKEVIDADEFARAKKDIAILEKNIGDLGIEFTGSFRTRLDSAVKKLAEFREETVKTAAVVEQTKAEVSADGVGGAPSKEAIENEKKNNETIFNLVKARMDKIRAIREANTKEVERVEELNRQKQEQRNIERRRTERQADKEVEHRRQEYFRKELERKEAIKQISIGAVYGVFDAFRMVQENKMLAINQEDERERKRIENSTLSEEEKQKQLEALDERTAKKKKQLARKQAILEKMTGLFSIGISTAQAIMKAWTLGPIIGKIMGGIIGVIGATQAAFVAAKPIPQALKGLFIKGSKGGTVVEAGEGKEDEIILPLKTGVRKLADELLGRLSNMSAMIPALMGSNTMTPAGIAATDGVPGPAVHWHLHIGTFIGDERGVKDLERRLSQYRFLEADRRGAR